MYSPEKWWFEAYFHFGKAHFQRRTVGFRESKNLGGYPPALKCPQGVSIPDHKMETRGDKSSCQGQAMENEVFI